MFKDVITIYNYYNDEWKRTVIKGVQFSNEVVKSISDGKLSLSDIVKITIPNSIQCGKTYMDYKRYSKLDSDTVDYYWTLNAEDNQDIVIRGNIDKNITAEYKLKDLREDYTCVTVCSVNDNTNKSRLKNIKVVCK